MECTKVNCPMQTGTPTDNCGENCPWRTTAKTGDLISRTALLNDLSYCAPELWQDEEYIKAKIIKQHTVDAVPVEWLEKFCADDIAEDQRETIEWMLGVWQREQEAR